MFAPFSLIVKSLFALAGYPVRSTSVERRG